MPLVLVHTRTPLSASHAPAADCGFSDANLALLKQLAAAPGCRHVHRSGHRRPDCRAHAMVPALIGERLLAHGQCTHGQMRWRVRIRQQRRVSSAGAAEPMVCRAGVWR